MALQNMQDQDMNLVLSNDEKPRLKWNPQLHQRFVNAVAQLGGAEKATPKSLMRVMGIHGLTLYHLKSHLQKYRLGKSPQSQTCIENDQTEYDEAQMNHPIRDYDGNQSQVDDLQIAQALQMQMEVQRKLHEQIEVQRHLQFRIEAQGKYLQNVLKKAEETLSGYNSTSAEVELAKSELCQLVSMIDNGCPSSSFSTLTEIRGSILKSTENNPLMGSRRCSLESCLTSTERCGQNEGNSLKHETDDTKNQQNSDSVELCLMEMHSGSTQKTRAGKRRENTISDGECVEQPLWKRSRGQGSCDQLRKFDFLETIDLNKHYSDPKERFKNLQGI